MRYYYYSKKLDMLIWTDGSADEGWAFYETDKGRRVYRNKTEEERHKDTVLNVLK